MTSKTTTMAEKTVIKRKRDAVETRILAMEDAMKRSTSQNDPDFVSHKEINDVILESAKRIRLLVQKVPEHDIGRLIATIDNLELVAQSACKSVSLPRFSSVTD